MFDNINEIDTTILLFIQKNFHCRFLDTIMPVITYLGHGGFLWILIGCVLLMMKKYRSIGFMMLCSLLLTLIINEYILKLLIQRPRPFIDIQSAKILISEPLSYSFPSGHTASSFAAFGILAKSFKKYGTLFIIPAVLISFSRLYLFVHYPSDILCGVILGLLCSGIVIFFFKRQKNKV